MLHLLDAAARPDEAGPRAMLAIDVLFFAQDAHWHQASPPAPARQVVLAQFTELRRRHRRPRAPLLLLAA